MSKPIGVHLIGRFGNQMFQYAYARALAEQQDRDLHTNAWAGQKIFDIANAPLRGDEEMLPEHYRQDQASLIYTRADARRWFAWRPEVEECLSELRAPELAAHRRKGDYVGSEGYPVIGISAFLTAMIEKGFGELTPTWVSEEHPCICDGFAGDLAFVPDFWRLTQAKVLFRANSSFSWWASTIGCGKTFSPNIEGLQGGIEHNVVPFSPGNHHRLAELPCCTDLYLS